MKPIRFPLAIVLSLFAGLLSQSRGDIAGFGDNGAAWSKNNVGGTPPVFSGDQLTIIQNGEQNTAKSAWFQTPQNITTGFTARFTLRRVNAGGPGAKEGTALVLQSSAAGTAAIGGSGTGLGYAALGGTPGIDMSIGFGFHAVVPAAGPSISQFQFGTNGAFGSAVATNPVDLTLVDEPVEVGVAFNPDNGMVRVSMIQNGKVFTTTVSNVSFTGSNLVGFTGATGTESQTIQVSNFTFGSDNEPTAVDDVVGFAGAFVDFHPLENDIDTDLASGDTLFIADTGTPRFGTLQLLDATTIRYVPGESFPGQDTFTYTVEDFGGQQSTANVIVTRDAGAGVFVGTSQGDPAIDPLLNAFTSLKVTPTGKFTGSVMWQGKKLATKGTFDALGQFTKVFSPNGAPKITLALDRLIEAGSINVKLDAPSTSTVTFQARPQTPVGKNGQLNVELRLASGTVEVGTGWAAGKVKPTGAAKFKGALPDGSKFSFASGFNVSQDIPFLTYLYKRGSRGAAIGTIRLFSTSSMVLTRPASSTKLYTAGFSERFTTSSRLYSKPLAGNPVLPFPAAGPVNGFLQLTGGGLPNIITQNIFLASNNKVSAIGANDTRLKVKLDLKKGLLSGSFKYPGSNKKTKYSGVIFGDEARGVFTGPATAGDALLATP